MFITANISESRGGDWWYYNEKTWKCSDLVTIKLLQNKNYSTLTAYLVTDRDALIVKSRQLFVYSLSPLVNYTTFLVIRTLYEFHQ